MTNAERKTHVIRILGTNRAGDILPEMWADVERIDYFDIMTQVRQGPDAAVTQYQKVRINLRWLDNPDADDYDPDGDRNREHRIVKVCDPALPPARLNDPDEWIPIRSIVQMKVKHAGGEILKVFKEISSDSDIDSRVVAVRRITHWETTIDDAAQSAFDADPTRKVYVVPDGNHDYTRIEDTEDQTQYVEHEIVKKLNRQDSQQLLSGGNDQRRVLTLRNQFQIDESRPAKLRELGTNNIDPPYRLDPFQNIININLGFEKQWLLGHDTGFGGSPFATSEDDHSWTGARVGASGMGYTVLVPRHIAFGSITLPDETKQSCFMREVAKVVSLGFIVDGAIAWQNVWTAPSDVRALSFANGRFFVTYDGDPGIRLALTTDGATFSANINPFPGFTDPGGWNVVWFDEKYVMAGYANVGGEGADLFAFNASLLWSTSSNGLSWSVGGSTDPYSGIGAGAAVEMSTALTAGKGLLVAAAAQKHSFVVEGDGRLRVLHASAVAVSSNGTSWTMIPLPGAEVRSSVPLGNRQSDCLAVAFIKAKQNGGFFVASDTASGGTELTGTSRMWKSIDGLTWTLEKTSAPYPAFGPTDIYITLSAIKKTLDATTTIIVT